MPAADGERAAAGARLRAVRQRRGVSQSELARRTSAARTYLVALEQGQHEPSLDLLRRIAAALQVPLAGLIHELAGEPFAAPGAPLAARVRLRRERLGLSASQVALRAATTRATVSQIETGVNANPGLELLARLARALHCCPSELAPAAAPHDGRASRKAQR
ncbi:MAG TPA: helix-turn-helix transcriptional regulator [Chloroflexota bacterium]|nr:helix-turn-helix transcriptional regulator [Chloroflexota bacterium]